MYLCSRSSTAAIMFPFFACFTVHLKRAIALSKKSALLLKPASLIRVSSSRYLSSGISNCIRMTFSCGPLRLAAGNGVVAGLDLDIRHKAFDGNDVRLGRFLETLQALGLAFRRFRCGFRHPRPFRPSVVCNYKTLLPRVTRADRHIPPITLEVLLLFRGFYE